MKILGKELIGKGKEIGYKKGHKNNFKKIAEVGKS